MSYHGLGLDLSFSASASGSGASASYSAPTASGSGGGGIDWGTVCAGHGGLKAKSYVSDLDYAFTCNDGFGCRKKPGSADVCGFSSASSAPPPPPSSPTTFYAASFGQKPAASNLLAAAASAMSKPATTTQTKTTFTPWMTPKPTQESAPPVPVVAPVEEDKTYLYVAGGIGLLILAGAGFYIAKRRY